MFDVIVIGGGVVGLAVARALTLDGQKVAVVERCPNLLEHASGGNSGIVCTGVDASTNSLERALIRDSVSMIRPYCREHNIPTRPCGSLVCLWKNIDEDGDADDDKESKSDDINFLDAPSTSHTGTEALTEVLNESHDAGDTHARIVSREEVTREDGMNEPNLNTSSLVGAVHIPGEIVVDPWMYSISLAIHAKENGCQIYTDYEVDIDDMTFDIDGNHDDGDVGCGIWTIRRKQNKKHRTNDEEESQRSDIDDNIAPESLQARLVINAAGLWAELIEGKIREGDKNCPDMSLSSSRPCPWQARPRRGQYRIYRVTPSTTIEHPIQPVPTPRTKGVFVFSNIFQNLLVVGPTALDQESKTDRTVHNNISSQLDDIAKHTVPSLDTTAQYVGDYVGIRPGTNHRDYQIHALPTKQWIAVAGIRSTGLTASLGIGNYVSRLANTILCSLPSTAENLADPDIKTTPMPSVDDLLESYQSSGKNGFVTIHGNDYLVTHPLSRMGFEEIMLSHHKNNDQ